MPRTDISFKTSDGVTLRGWFYTPFSPLYCSLDSKTLPCLVMSHGFTALKEMDLDAFAEHFISQLSITCLVYDNRNFGASDSSDEKSRYEIVPAQQISDISDAVTYAQTLDEVDRERVGVWGSSYSGGHVLMVGAVDRRVKAVLSQVPLTSGWENFHRLVRPDFIPGFNQQFQDDRHARAAGKDPTIIPVVAQDPLSPSALPTPDSFTFFNAWESKSDWKNSVTMRSMELLRGYEPAAMIHRISPTPLLMTVAERDVLTPTDLALEAYGQAREPKELNLLRGAGHFDGYTGDWFERNAGKQVEFLRKWLCKG